MVTIRTLCLSYQMNFSSKSIDHNTFFISCVAVIGLYIFGITIFLGPIFYFWGRTQIFLLCHCCLYPGSILCIDIYYILCRSILFIAACTLSKLRILAMFIFIFCYFSLSKIHIPKIFNYVWNIKMFTNV